MAPELYTPRLLLKPLQMDDAEQIQQVFPKWEIVQFLNASVPWPYPADGALRYCCDVALPAVAQGREWHWTLRLKTHPERVIGAISLSKGDSINRGFWLAPEWQNQGLMTEAVIAANDYWFNTLQFATLRTPKAVGNVASRRVSEKTGMRLVELKEHEYVSGRFVTEIWELTAEEWRNKRASMEQAT